LQENEGGVKKVGRHHEVGGCWRIERSNQKEEKTWRGRVTRGKGDSKNGLEEKTN